MDSFFGRLNLYDFLACLVPGYLLLGKFLPDTGTTSYSVTDYVLIFAASYVIGLLWKAFMEWVWTKCKMRNNPKHIMKALYKSEFEIDAKKEIIKQIENLLEREDYGQSVKSIYYRCYYQAVNRCKSTSISFLESQLAFLRSIAFVLPLYLAPYFSQFTEIKFVVILLLIFCVFLILWLCKHIQSKIYKLVWEDSYYISKVAER